MRPLITLTTLAFYLCHQVQAIVYIDASCPSLVHEHLKDAIEMAKVAADAIGKKSPRDAGDGSTTKGLYQVLFDELDRQAIKTTYEKISKIESTIFEITLFCNEDTIIWPTNADKNTDKDALFYSSKFHDENNQEATLWLGNENPVTLPRKTGCEQGNEAYNINGYHNSGVHLSNQVHIILCPSLVQGDSTRDRRRIPDIRKDGIKQNYYHLDHMRMIAGVILHEFTHTTPVSGPLNSLNQPGILDGDISYGFIGASALKKKDSRAPAKNADSYAVLAIALSLQFEDKVKSFTWATGALNIQNGNRKDYTPYIPARKPPKRDLERTEDGLDRLDRKTAAKKEAQTNRQG